MINSVARWPRDDVVFDAILREDRSILELLDSDFVHEQASRDSTGFATRWSNRFDQEDRVDGGQRIRGREFVRVEVAQDGQRWNPHPSQYLGRDIQSDSNQSREAWTLGVGASSGRATPTTSTQCSRSRERGRGGRHRFAARDWAHRQNPTCANCHAKMDAIGFALENFDAIGAFRTSDGEFEIDASGEFPDGASFVGVEELKRILLEKSDDFTRCLTEKMLIYALGRGLEYYDRLADGSSQASVAADGYRLPNPDQTDRAQPTLSGHEGVVASAGQPAKPMIRWQTHASGNLRVEVLMSRIPATPQPTKSKAWKANGKPEA
ncbi:MAG: DUF1585 domain-containing protein [Pirellulaceae bacterium]